MKIKARGKLLLTSEYLVLLGAKALALPTKLGQEFQVFPLRFSVISWKSYDEKDNLWINETFLYDEIFSFEAKELENNPKNRLLQILKEAHFLNPNILTKNRGYFVESFLQFPKNWGLGTSSTLIYFVAQWFEINPYKLLEKTFGGSGYDVACAGAIQPIFYTKKDIPIIEKVDFYPNFHSQLYFLHLNKKKNSREAIEKFKEKIPTISQEILTTFDRLTDEIAQAKTLEDFCRLIDLHEKKMSLLLGILPVKEQLFSDFQGSIKSLGGWGGDFVLVATTTCPRSYFSAKGYDTLLCYKDFFEE